MATRGPGSRLRIRPARKVRMRHNRASRASNDNCQPCGSAGRTSRSSKAAASAGMDFIPQHHEVPGFFALSADDAWPNVIGIALAGKRWRSRYRRTEDIWPRPIFLLRSAHSIDPFRRNDCFTAAHGFGCAVAVHEPSCNESTFAARVCLESWIALFGLADSCGGALYSMPVVCGTETAEKGHWIPQLFVKSRCRYAF